MSGIKGLTDKQRRFCEEYIIDWNATQAAIRAGYSSKSAAAEASRLLRNVNISSYVESIKDDLKRLSGVTVLRNMITLAKIAYPKEGIPDNERNQIDAIKELNKMIGGYEPEKLEVKDTTLEYDENKRKAALDTLSKFYHTDKT